MCGINGAISFTDNFRITPEYITTMRDAMVHRGPDGADTWVAHDGRVGLGHRRLSIIDLSNAAAQPMSTFDRRYWLSFNGEIYNHQEIRDELIKLGHTQWKTDHSDTEVILYAFAQWGIDCLHKFRGMFAFALWDDHKKELWLVRDRVGIKPLYYSIHNERLVFASEIKALLKDAGQKRAVDEEAFFHYLSFLTTPAPQTLFADVKKLSPGTWLKITLDGHITARKYWDVLDNTKSLHGVSENDIAAMVLDELRTAVKLRKVSDVPVGVFLSGGIDSSTNAALFSEGASPQSVNTFSIGYHGEYKTYQNELHYAKIIADQVGAKYHEKLLHLDDLLDFLPQMVDLQDEPIADPVCVPVYFVSKLARDNKVIVCQVGEGADELFWGYPAWKTKLNLQRYNNLFPINSLKKLGLSVLNRMGKSESVEYELLRRGANGVPIFWGGAEAFTEAQKRNLMSPRLQKHFAGRTSWEALAPIHQRFQEKAQEKSILNWMSYVDLNFRLPELLLMRVDKMSMGVSLECRVPFLDHKFVELAMSIPTAMKTKDGQLKYLLKKAVRGLIPDQLIDRKKQGFGVPVYEWFFDRLGDRIKTELEEFCEQTDFLNPNAVRSLLDKKQGPQAWYLLNFALWWKQYVK